MGWLHVFAVVDVFAVQDRRQERSVTAYMIGQRAVVNTAELGIYSEDKHSTLQDALD